LNECVFQVNFSDDRIVRFANDCALALITIRDEALLFFFANSNWLNSLFFALIL